MRIKINITKIHILIFLFIILITSIYFVVAQTTSPNPGHTASQISGVCPTAGGPSCPSCLSSSNVVYKVPANIQCANPILCYPPPIGSVGILAPSRFSYSSAQGSYGFIHTDNIWYDCVFVFCRN